MIHAEARAETPSPASDPEELATDDDEAPYVDDVAGTGPSRATS
jgi:hypothetical protein